MPDGDPWAVPAALDGERLDRVIALVSGLARSQVNEMMSAGMVSIGGRTSTQRSRRVRAGEKVVVTGSLPGAVVTPVDDRPLADFVEVFVDDEVIVVDKPAGVVVHPGAANATGTLIQALVGRYGDLSHLDVGDQAGRPGVVHRLDKGTSGLLVVARTEHARASLVEQLSKRSVSRRYVALVRGTVESDSGMIDAPLGRSARDPTRFSVVAGGREARTRYEVVARHAGPMESSELALALETGRTHQIRVHVAAIGHPVVGDPRYGGRSGPFRSLLQPERFFLHAASLGFDHPASGVRMEFDSRLPDDLVGALGQVKEAAAGL